MLCERMFLQNNVADSNLNNSFKIYGWKSVSTVVVRGGHTRVVEENAAVQASKHIRFDSMVFKLLLTPYWLLIH